MKKVVFLDRDGVLNEDTHYPHELSDYHRLPGVVEGLLALQEAGYVLVILTSQSGIGRGMYTEAQYQKFATHQLRDLAEGGVNITGVFFCPHHLEEGVGEYRIDCECRKPKPGLVKQAAAALGPFDYSSSWIIGDRGRDIEMAQNADARIRGVLVPKNVLDKFDDSDTRTHRAESFLEAVNYILSTA